MNEQLAVLPRGTAADMSSAIHEPCCTDEEVRTDQLAMCGALIPAGAVEIGGDPDCVVCLDLIELWAEYADRYGENPGAGDDPCRVCPRRRTEDPHD